MSGELCDRLFAVIRQNVLGGSAFAESVRAELADAILPVIEEAVAAERERCARVAETRYFGGGYVGSANRWGAKQAAAAIRGGESE